MTCSGAPSSGHPWLTLVLPTIISVAALLLVAWGQLKRDKQKLRLDLYNRRFSIFDRTIVFLRALEGSPGAERFHSQHIAFIHASKEARFLFTEKSGIPQLLDRLRNDCLAKKPAGGPAANDYAIWLDEITKQLETKIGPYLNFQKAVI